MKAWGNLNNWVIARGKLTKVGILISAGLTPFMVFGQDTGSSGVTSSAAQEFGAILNRLINFSLGLLVILAVAVIIYISFMFLFAGGNTDKVQTARRYLVYIIVAVAVALLSKVFIAIVFEIAGKDSPF